LVYGYASDADEIKNNGALMQRAYELGRDLGT
jgi:hypothetical protein